MRKAAMICLVILILVNMTACAGTLPWGRDPVRAVLASVETLLQAGGCAILQCGETTVRMDAPADKGQPLLLTAGERLVELRGTQAEIYESGKLLRTAALPIAPAALLQALLALADGSSEDTTPLKTALDALCALLSTVHTDSGFFIDYSALPNALQQLSAWFGSREGRACLGYSRTKEDGAVLFRFAPPDAAALAQGVHTHLAPALLRTDDVNGGLWEGQEMQIIIK